MSAERREPPSREPPREPVSRDVRASYRIQLNPAFGFADLESAAPYLAELGVSHVYLSPILQAAPGSTHGYDAVDPTRVNRELGGADGYARLGDALGRAGLGQVLDIVPNHMAIGSGDNPWWWDVLENGPASRYAGHFDVDWDHPEGHLRNRVLLPQLGDHYGRVLEAGELRLEWDGSRFTIRHGERRFPVAPPSLDELLARAAERAGSAELAWLADEFGALPPSSVTDRPTIERRHRDTAILSARLAELAAAEPAIGEAIEAVVAAINADADALDRLLDRQNYRLAWWRSARRDLGYRRFFDVTTLAGLRTEDPRVFADTHELILPWLGDGVIDGVRVDHPDGLRDPEAYFRRLRWASPRAWIVAEKILQPGEELRRSWPIDGTTGYDFLNEIQQVLVDPDGAVPLAALAARFTGDGRAWEEVVRDAKLLVLRDVLGSELGRLTSVLLDVLERHRRHRDHTRHDLHEALRALVAAFPVYRTYVRPSAFEAAADGTASTGSLPAGASAGNVAPEDEATIRTSVETAKERRPDLPADLFDVIADVLLLRIQGDAEAEFVARFQQLTGPVMAKGVEDTAFYRYLRLTALNEVGGDPGTFGRDVDAFHAWAAGIQDRWPATMLATSTHDTKRSEDVRARLLVLAERAGDWAEIVGRWSAHNERHRAGDRHDPAVEYLVYQTLVGAWPIDAERLATFLTKAMREAKRVTRWVEPDEAYEVAQQSFAAALLRDDAFTSDLDAFVRSVLVPGRVNSLAQLLVKLAAPGVPDTYQGTELWDLTLVDPDNRRQVAFDLRRACLRELDACSPEDLVERLADPADPGLPKLHVVRAALALRSRRADVFGRRSTYTPLVATGPRAGHVLGFVRTDAAAVVVPRLPVGLAGDWSDTAIRLPDGRWTDVLTGDAVDASAAIPVGRLLARFPVALLERGDEREHDRDAQAVSAA